LCSWSQLEIRQQILEEQLRVTRTLAQQNKKEREETEFKLETLFRKRQATNKLLNEKLRILSQHRKSIEQKNIETSIQQELNTKFTSPTHSIEHVMSTPLETNTHQITQHNSIQDHSQQLVPLSPSSLTKSSNKSTQLSMTSENLEFRSSPITTTTTSSSLQRNVGIRTSNVMDNSKEVTNTIESSHLTTTTTTTTATTKSTKSKPTTTTNQTKSLSQYKHQQQLPLSSSSISSPLTLIKQKTSSKISEKNQIEKRGQDLPLSTIQIPSTPPLPSLPALTATAQHVWTYLCDFFTSRSSPSLIDCCNSLISTFVSRMMVPRFSGKMTVLFDLESISSMKLKNDQEKSETINTNFSVFARDPTVTGYLPHVVSLRSSEDMHIQLQPLLLDTSHSPFIQHNVVSHFFVSI
jgi:hypothetical protein